MSRITLGGFDARARARGGRRRDDDAVTVQHRFGLGCGQCDESGQDHQEREQHFGEGRDERRAARVEHRVGRHRPLHDEIIRAPITEREHEPQPRHEAEGVDPQQVGVGRFHAGPGVRESCGHLRDDAVPAAAGLESKEDEREKSGDDEEELQHFVVHRAAQTAGKNVGEDDHRRHDHRNVEDVVGRNVHRVERRVEDVHRYQELGHRVHRYAGREHGHDGERARIESARFFIEAQFEVLGHRAGFGTVIERHHENADEHHRRDRAEPVKMRGQNAVFRAGGGHADDFLGAQIGAHEGQTADPQRHRASGEKELLAVLRLSAEHEPDAQHEREVEDHDEPVDGCQDHEQSEPR